MKFKQKKQTGRNFGESESYKQSTARQFTDDVRYRDVRDQDLDRREVGRVSSKKKTYIGIGLLTFFVFLLTWVGVSLLNFLVAQVGFKFDELMGAEELIKPVEHLFFDGSFSILFGGLGLGFGLTFNIVLILAITLIVFGIIYNRMMARWKTENIIDDTSGLNSYINDNHIALLEEMQTELDYFPDAGATSSVSPNSIISHLALSKKGLQKVEVAKRHQSDDPENHIFKGDFVRDDDGEVVLEKKPIIDEDFGQDLFSSSGVKTVDEVSGRQDKKAVQKIRTPFIASQIPYNEGGIDRDKLKFDKVDDLIKNDWTVEPYETVLPGGAYLVDTSPTNTNVIAITRGGKGQTYIEPMIDIWTRERKKHNIVVNDPKGELTVQFYVPATMRGYEMVRFDLMNPAKTDVYNLLLIAAEYAKEGDFVNTAQYIDNAADVFFPKENADNPMWPNAASNAFKRSVYGLIAYYMSEEDYIRDKAMIQGWSDSELTQTLDELWGHVSLYNAFQLFTVLSGMKSTDEEKIRIDENDTATEKDFLTLFFDAMAKLPTNGIRRLVANADNSLRAMAGSDKTIASVYGIAITEMSFFTDPTISTLTSGRPSMNFDVRSLSFPRRIRVRFDSKFATKYDFYGKSSRWTMYRDKNFTDQYEGSNYTHDQIVDRNGWSVFAFEGKVEYEDDEVPTAYVRLDILNPDTGSLVRSFFFELELTFRKSLNGRRYLLDPVLNKRIVKDGVLKEMKQVRKPDGSLHYIYDVSVIKERYIDIASSEKGEQVRDVPVFAQKIVNYVENPKFISYITPPHLKSYAKLSLIMLKQTIDANFASSYTTKDSQKPLYKTRYMLDELGNLESGGSGIQGLQTYLSIGLGQDQIFTLILQTLQQLRDVYGESVDKIISGNIGNTIFLKSNDNDMLDTLEKWSGKTHRVRITGRTVTKDKSVLPGAVESDSRESINQGFTEEPVISASEMLSLPERDSIVFRTGKNVIWNRGETILPMSWRLLGANPIRIPGKSFSLETLPTNSLAPKFDLESYQPEFIKILDFLLLQASHVDSVIEDYKKVYNLSDDEIAKLNQEDFAREIMRAVNHRIRPISPNRYGKKEEKTAVSQLEQDFNQAIVDLRADEDDPKSLEEAYKIVSARYKSAFEKNGESMPTYESFAQNAISEGQIIEGMLANKGGSIADGAVENDELKAEQAKYEAETERSDEKLYAQKMISESDLIERNGSPHSGVIHVLSIAYGRSWKDFVKAGNVGNLIVDKNGELTNKSGEVFAQKTIQDTKGVVESSSNDRTRVYDGTEDGLTEEELESLNYTVTPAFVKYLCHQDSWLHLAGGEFDREVAKAWRQADRLSD